MIDFRPWGPPALIWLLAARSALFWLEFCARLCGRVGARPSGAEIVPFPRGPSAPAPAGGSPPAGRLIHFDPLLPPARAR